MDESSLKTRWAQLDTAVDRRAYDDVSHCNRCGFCTSFCPTYLATGDESLSPRGRNQALRGVLENRLSPGDAARSFETCLQCGICTSVCFAQVPTGTLMSGARTKVGLPLLARFVIRFLLPRPWLFEGLMKLLLLPKRWGVTGLLRKLGFQKWAPSLAEADAALKKVPASFLRDRLPPAAPDTDVVQFLACGPNLLLPEVGEATAALVTKAGKRSGAAPTVCCGLPGVSLGDLDGARALARKNIEILEGFPRAVILVDDSSCAATLKNYPQLLQDDPAWAPRATALRARMKDLIEWLDENPGIARVAGNPVVTYHDSCKARFGQGLVQEPRRVLTAAGADLKELTDAEQCCGGGGTYSFTQIDISRAVGARKAETVSTTRAPVVLTSSVSCLLQLRASLKRAGSTARAETLGVFLSGQRF